MTRLEFIAMCDELGIKCDVIKSMTDAEFDDHQAFLDERHRKNRSEWDDLWTRDRERNEA